jgi:hypothetical protein
MATLPHVRPMPRGLYSSQFASGRVNIRSYKELVPEHDRWGVATGAVTAGG